MYISVRIVDIMYNGKRPGIKRRAVRVTKL